MNTLTYKDFVGSFNYIEEEEMLYGKLQGISDLVTFQGTSITEVKNAFIEAVDDYIELCKEVNKDPFKSFKGTFNIRISPALHRQATLKASRHNLNLNQFVQKAIEQAVNQ